MDYEPGRVTAKPKRPLWTLLALPLVAFLAGLAAMGWLLANWSNAATFLGVAAAPPPAAVEPEPQPMTVEREPAAATPAEPQSGERLVIDPETTRRVNRLEERLALLDLQSRTAVGNADRAEGLLVAFAARRAIDREWRGLYRDLAAALRRTPSRRRWRPFSRRPAAGDGAEPPESSSRRSRPIFPAAAQGQTCVGVQDRDGRPRHHQAREYAPTRPPSACAAPARAWNRDRSRWALLEVLRLRPRAADPWIADARRLRPSHRALDGWRAAACSSRGRRCLPAVRPSAEREAPLAPLRVEARMRV